MTWPEGSSEMASRLRAYDWDGTILGPADRWPSILRHTVELLLAYPLPMVLFWGPDLIHIYNDGYAGLLGEKDRTALGGTMQELWPDAMRQEQLLFDRIWGGEAIQLDAVLYPDPGTDRDKWYMLTYTPVRDSHGQVAGILLTIFDKTGERNAERLIREAQERQAFLLRLSDALRPIADAAEIRRTAMRLIHERLNALRCIYLEAEADGDTLMIAQGVNVDIAHLPEKYRISDFGAWIAEEFAQGRTVAIHDAESDPRIDDRSRAIFRQSGSRASVGLPLCKDGRLAAVVAIDLAEPRTWTDAELHLLEEVVERTCHAMERARAEWALRQSEEHLRMLVAELQHRVRNILTVVRSVFTRTIQAGGDLADLADHFRGRMDALARTQVIVTQTAAGTADLENLIRDELISVGVCDGPNVRIEGPDVTLSKEIAQSLGLAIHELTTNALKYGALKVDGATLDIQWTVRTGIDGSPTLDLLWREQSVPAIVAEPRHEGFGRELIEQALPYQIGADTALQFKGGGVHCSISVPLGVRCDAS